LQPKTAGPVGGSFGLKAGKSFFIGETGKLNLFATASFDNGFTYREGLNQTLNAQGAKLKSFHQEKFSHTTNTTGMFNANYHLNDNNRLAYNFYTSIHLIYQEISTMVATVILKEITIHI